MVQIINIRNEKGEITSDTTETQRIIKNYYKQLYANKIYNLEEMGKFLQRYNQPSKTEPGRNRNMNRTITSTEIETVI